MQRTSVTRSSALAAALVALSLALTGCGVDTSPARAVAAEQTATPVSAPATSSAPTPPATSTPTPSPVSAPTRSTTTSAQGPAGTTATVTTPTAAPTDVSAVQRRLRELRYYAGDADGRSGSATRSAVMAFQKVNGLAADGAVGPRTLAALAAPRAPQLRLGSPADRVEVDLDLQVLHVVEDGRIVRTMPVSSGNGETYRQQDGSRARALTPVGTYRIERRIVGVREAPLGTLYDPQYFHHGWAIHGSHSVPAGPASHGCVRVTRADAKALRRLVDVGTTVHLHGGRHVFSPGSSAAGTSTAAA